jgi:large subunit ribosomal protein L13e
LITVKPKPKVFKKGGKQRLGKGFSREELKEVGLTLKDALRMGVPVDCQRRTAHEENIQIIKNFVKDNKPKPRSKQKSKR